MLSTAIVHVPQLMREIDTSLSALEQPQANRPTTLGQNRFKSRPREPILLSRKTIDCGTIDNGYGPENLCISIVSCCI